jgi:rhomboid family GlyGly-CTERM serine protease
VTPIRSSGLLSVAIRRLLESWAVVALALLCLALAAGGDEARELGRYERLAIENGEYWRLVTAHLVHLSIGHLWPNLAALAILGLLLDDVFRNADWWWVAAVSAAAIDAGLYLYQPGVFWYVGLSGVLHGVVAGGAIALFTRHRVLGAVLALGLTAKLGFEQIFGAVPFTAESVGGPVVVSAHLYGALGGALAEAAARIARRGSRV